MVLNRLGKPRNEFIKPEELNLDETYSFNFNPVDQPSPGHVNSVKDWWERINYIFSKTIKYSDYKLYMEISSTGRYHFHGLIKVKNYKFYTWDVHRLMDNGTCSMKLIDNREVWETYYLKQQKIWQSYLQDELYGPLIKHKGLIFIGSL